MCRRKFGALLRPSDPTASSLIGYDGKGIASCLQILAAV
jgi:hypothetical protein